MGFGEIELAPVRQLEARPPDAGFASRGPFASARRIASAFASEETTHAMHQIQAITRDVHQLVDVPWIPTRMHPTVRRS